MRAIQLFAAVAALFAASPAGAFVVTFQGVVSRGFDETGVFGAPNTSLAGAAFTETFIFDETEGVSIFYPPLSSSYSATLLFDPHPRAAITINGHTFAFGCGEVCVARADRSAGGGGAWSESASFNASFVDTSNPALIRIFDAAASGGVFSSLHPFVTDYRYLAPVDYLLQAGDMSSGHFSVSDRLLPECGGGICPEIPTASASADLTPLSMSVYVPEPATWMGMILGFALTGVALRRRGGCARPRPGRTQRLAQLSA